jgi:hypothetical protein
MYRCSRPTEWLLKNGGSHGACRYSCSWCPSKPSMNSMELGITTRLHRHCSSSQPASPPYNQPPPRAVTFIFFTTTKQYKCFFDSEEQTSRPRLQERTARRVTQLPQVMMRMVCRISPYVAGSKESQYPFNHSLNKTALLELESRSWLCAGCKKYLENRTNCKFF